MQLIDLSQTVTDNLPVFPGDDPVLLEQTRFLDTDQYNDHRIEMGMHAGTHIDGPMHLTASREYVSELPLDRFMAPGCCLDVRGQPIIQWRPEFARVIPENCILLLYTGHDRQFGQSAYFEDYPVLAPEFSRAVVQKRIKMLGLDSPSPDRPPYLIHRELLQQGIYLIENLTNLAVLAGRESFEVIALPLKIRANSAPARVIARI